MAAIALSGIVSLLLGAVVWLVIGTRLRLTEHDASNDWYNVAAYAALWLPFMFVLIAIGFSRA